MVAKKLKASLIRVFCLVLAVVLALAAAGCKGSSKKKNSKNTGKNNSVVASAIDETNSSDSSGIMDDEYEDEDEDEQPELIDDSVPKEDLEIEELTVYNNKPIAPFRGVNYIYHPFNYFSDSFGREYTEEMRQLELTRIQKMQPKILRSYYGSSLSWDAEKQRFDFNSADMQQFYRFCRDMATANSEIGIFATWDLKGLIREDDGWGGNKSLLSPGLCVPDDLEASVKRFRNFMKDSVLAFKANGVNNIKYMFAFTECNNTFVTKWDSTVYEQRQFDKLLPIYDKAIRALDGGLKDAGMRQQFKIVAPCDACDGDYDEFGYSMMVRYTIEHLKNQVDIIGSHLSYIRNSEDFTKDVYNELATEVSLKAISEPKAAGMEYWVDETNVNTTDGSKSTALRVAVSKQSWKGTALGAAAAGYMENGVSSFFLWSLSDQAFGGISNGVEWANGLQLVGYLPSLMVDSVPYKSWYAAALLSKYLGAGTSYSCDQNLAMYGSCVKRDDGEFTVAVTNYNFTETILKLNFTESLKGKTLYRHVYDPNTIKATSQAIVPRVSGVAKNVTSGFYDTIPAGAVVIYTTVQD